MKTRILQILGVAAIATIGMVSCDTDACKDVECGVNGTCLEGDCVCDAGYEGVSCETESRVKFNGTYLASGTITCPESGNGTLSDETLTIAASSAAANKVTIDLAGAILLTATVNGSDLTVDPKTVNGLEYTGSGTLNASGTTLSFTINEVEPNVETCVYSLTCVKQ